MQFRKVSSVSTTSRSTAREFPVTQEQQERIRRVFTEEFGKALDYSNEMFASLCVTEDAKEGIDAFLDQRQAVWKER